MLDGRFHLNSSPLGTILNLWSTTSFSDSVDELEVNWMSMRMRKATFSFFLALTLTFFVSFCWSLLLSPGLMKGKLFFFSLSCFVYLAFLLRKSLGFLIPSFLDHHMSYLQLYHFFSCLITGVNYRENNSSIMLICMQRLSIFQTFWHHLTYGIYILR